MPTAAWVAILVTLSIFVLTNLGVSLWWASRTTTLLDIVQVDLKDVITELKAMRGMYSTKEEVAQALAAVDKAQAVELAAHEKQLTAIWKQLDERRGVSSGGG